MMKKKDKNLTYLEKGQLSLSCFFLMIDALVKLLPYMQIIWTSTFHSDEPKSFMSLPHLYYFYTMGSRRAL